MSPAEAVTFTVLGAGVGIAVTEGMNYLAAKVLPHACEQCADVHGDQAFTEDEVATMRMRWENARLRIENQELRALMERFGLQVPT